MATEALGLSRPETATVFSALTTKGWIERTQAHFMTYSLPDHLPIPEASESEHTDIR